MYKYYNAHPKGLWIDDCLKRAIAVTTRMDYSDVLRKLDDFKSNEEMHFVEDVLGAKRIKYPSRGVGKMTASRFCKIHRRGRYILEMQGHFTACIDGILLDTWDPSDEVVLSAYRVAAMKDEPMIRLRLCYTVCFLDEENTNVTFYDSNGRFTSKTLSAQDASEYIESLQRRGYPDMTEADKWL
jgi:hypothetical protein